MTPQDPSAMTDEELIERLAVEVMQNPALLLSPKLWNPLADWNDWREVEKKVMRDEDLLHTYVTKLCAGEGTLSDETNEHIIKTLIVADLPTRCRALLAALSAVRQ